MHHKHLLYLLLLSSLSLNAMHDHKNANEISIHKAAFFGNTKRMQKLLDSGTNIDERSKEDGYATFYQQNRESKQKEIYKKDDSPLFVALRHENQPMVQFLLKHNASVDAKNYHGWSPFLYALHGGKVEYVKVFLTCGANIDQKNFGYTPFLMLRWNLSSPRFLSMVKTFLKYNAPVNIEDDDGKTALDYLRLIDGIREFYLDNEKSLKKTKKKKKKVKRKKQKQRKLVINKDKN